MTSDNEDNLDQCADDNKHPSRERRPTEKGLQYNRDLYDKQRRGLCEEMFSKICTIQNLMRSSKCKETVSHELKNLDSIYEEFNYVNEKYQALLNDIERQDDQAFCVRADSETVMLKQEAMRWLRDQDDIKSRSSRRSKSSNGSASTASKSSIKKKILEEKLELANIKAELKFPTPRSKEEELATAVDIARRDARIDVYKSHLEEEREENESIKARSIGNFVLENDKDNVVNFPERNFVPFSASVDATKHPEVNMQNTFSETLCELLKLQSAPEISLDVYDGNPLNYRYFIATFEEVVERKIKDARGRLMRLIQYTTGEAKELIKCCVHRDALVGYAHAKDLLYKQFGDPHRILNAYINELKQWRQIKPGDASEFRKFYSFLLKCNGLIKGQYWSCLDSPDNICTIIMKLPVHSRDKWNKNALIIRRHKHREPQLDDVLEFVDEECTLANDPLYSREALNERHGNSNINPETKRRGIKTLVSKVVCPSCEKIHDLESCNAFKSMTIRERSKWVLKNRLCFGCFEKGHIAKNCKKRRTCKTCNGKHPTTLHKDKEQNKEKPNSPNDQTNNPLSSMHIGSPGESISMSIVPVLVRHETATKDVLTYALLDDCSQGTFIDEDLIDCLGIDGVDTEILVNTLTGKNTQKSKLIHGLMVKGAVSGDWLSLPKAYSRSNLPISKE